MRATTIAILFVCLLAMSACGSDEAPIADDSGGTHASLAGEWTLIAATFDGVDLHTPEPSPPSMTIELGDISGNGGCNTFGGTIDFDGAGSLRISEMFWTEMACADPERMNFESRYLPALAASTGWVATPNNLTFTGPSATLIFAPADPPVDLPLETTPWIFDTIYSGEGSAGTASTPDRSRPEVTLALVGQEAELASDDCGLFLFPLDYEVGNEGRVAIPATVRIGRPVCADPDSNMYAAFDGVISASGYTINESRLTFIGEPGELVGFHSGG